MPSTGFNGVHKLDVATIDSVVNETSPGVYVLTRKSVAETFYVNYVGRSDSDLNARLKQWAATGKYTHFKAAYYSTAKAAFEKECTIFHDFGGLDNTNHPQRPAGTSYDCPAPGCDDLD